jgi:beta-adrenergic-receptor kinase
MEELQDAIEDAQYVNAIATQEDGPRPVLPWERPSEEQLAAWEAKKRPEGLDTVDWTLSTPIGLFLFSSFIKESHGDYLRINFCEDVQRFKALGGKARVDHAKLILLRYLSPGERPPPKTEIQEYDLERKIPRKKLSKVELDKLYERTFDYPVCSASVIGVKGPVLYQIRDTIHNVPDVPATTTPSLASFQNNSTHTVKTDTERHRQQNIKDDDSNHNANDASFSSDGHHVLSELDDTFPTTIVTGEEGAQLSSAASSEIPLPLEGPRALADAPVSGAGGSSKLTGPETPPSRPSHQSSTSRSTVSAASVASQESLRLLRSQSLAPSQTLSGSVFDEAERVVMESLGRGYWDAFLASDHYRKLKHFLWYRDRPVVPEDFFVMRVLGRGGFGLVNGT